MDCDAKLMGLQRCTDFAKDLNKIWWSFDQFLTSIWPFFFGFLFDRKIISRFLPFFFVLPWKWDLIWKFADPCACWSLQDTSSGRWDRPFRRWCTKTIWQRAKNSARCKSRWRCPRYYSEAGLHRFQAHHRANLEQLKEKVDYFAKTFRHFFQRLQLRNENSACKNSSRCCCCSKVHWALNKFRLTDKHSLIKNTSKTHIRQSKKSASSLT